MLKRKLSIVSIIILIVLMLGLLLFSGGKLISYMHQARKSSDHHAQLQQHIQMPESAQAETAQVEIPVQIDFAALQADCPDIYAWLYCPDTQLNDPVVQSQDNAYYERRLTDGSWNMAGSLFMDFQNAPDITDPNTIIYGHNMNNHTRFGNFEKYREQAYYEEHPIMWFFTPETTYRLHLAAGYLVRADDACYLLPQTVEARNGFIRQAMEKSTFTPLEAPDFEASWLTLSTCAYDYDDARYILMGYLEPVENS